MASTSTLSLANRILALILGGVRGIYGSIPREGALDCSPPDLGHAAAGNPTLWAPLILVGIVTVLFGLTNMVAWLNSQSIGLRLLAVVLTVVASAAAWFLTSMSLPHEECEWWELTPGAAIVGTGVGLLHVLTITYIAYEVSRKSSLYGAIGISIALLLWTYFAGRLLTAAIATNATLWKRRRARTSTNRAGPSDSEVT